MEKVPWERMFRRHGLFRMVRARVSRRGTPRMDGAAGGPDLGLLRAAALDEDAGEAMTIGDHRRLAVGARALSQQLHVQSARRRVAASGFHYLSSDTLHNLLVAQTHQYQGK
jgi:hypothetical protein